MSQIERDAPPGLVCLCVIANTFQIHANPEHLMRSVGGAGEFGDDDILAAAKLIRLKARRIKVKLTQLASLPLPAIARLSEAGHVLVSKFEDGIVYCVDPAHPGAPLLLTAAAFYTDCEGHLIVVRSEQGAVEPEQAFGLGWFMRAIVKYKSALFEVALASIFIQLFALALPIFIQLIIDKVLSHRNIDTLNVLACGMLIIIVFETVFVALQGYLISHTSNRLDSLLGAKVVAHLLRLPLRYFETRRVGDTVARVRELENIRQFLTGTSLSTLLDAVFVVFFIGAMLFYSKELTLITAMAIPVLVGITFGVRTLMRQRLNLRFNCGADSGSFLVEAVSGIHAIKALAAEPQIQRKWDRLLARYTGATFRTGTLAAYGGAAGQAVERAVGLLVLWVGASLVMKGQLSAGQLIAFQMLASRVTHPLVRIVELWQNFQQLGVSIERMGDLMNTKPEAPAGVAPGMARLKGHISLEKLSFRYALQSQPVIQELNLTIPAGTTLGIVGRSGSGKSTLAKLLQGLYPAYSGRVLIDNMDIQQCDLASLRRQIGVVLQENYLFNGTVRENIALHAPQAPFEAVMGAAGLAGAHEFIAELPGGYDSVVGERGVALSGGQRQRIAIARALLCNPPILIFDEATSALDYESERIVQDNLAKICHGRTVIIIAHRLSAVRHADQIIVLDRGELLESGSHSELIGEDGLYAALHALQMRPQHD